MIGQLTLGIDGVMKDKVDVAIERIKAFCPEEGYFVAFSGGKDSQCIYHLCRMAGVKFDAHYAVTSVDPPELIKFIKTHYPDVIFDIPHDENGKRVSMWSLIPERLMPPTRLVRYCCQELKEVYGGGRVTVTGVRWAESSNRKMSHGVVTIAKKSKKVAKRLTSMGADFSIGKSGGVILNYDDAIDRRTTEFCMRTGRMLVNPIIDWDEDDVWDFLNSYGIEHCSLYDEGFKRLGCIGCPMSNLQQHEFERWPKYKEMYRRAFAKMLEEREKRNLVTSYKTADDVMTWWMRKDKGKNKKESEEDWIGKEVGD